MDDRDEQPLFITPVSPTKPRKAGFNVNYPLLFGAVGLFAFGIFAAVFLLGSGPQGADRGTPSLAEARACLEQRDITCAEADYRAYVAKYPSDGRANAILAITLTQDGQHADAIPYYKKALALGVSTYDLYAGYAISLNVTGQVDDAIKMNYAALKLVPTLVDVRGALADQLAGRGRVQEAVDVLQSFDQTLQDDGQAPYFEAKIEEIRTAHGLAEPAAPASNAVTAPVPPGQAVEVALQAGSGALYVPVVVDDSLPLRFVVDSGASLVSIPADVARTLMRTGKLGPGDFVGQGTLTLANGERVRSQIVMIRSMSVGGHEVRNVMASISNDNGALLLGQSFLHHFKSWSIDNHRKVLVLQG